jgi:hypothetical protein
MSYPNITPPYAPGFNINPAPQPNSNYNDIMNQVRACVKNCEPFKQNMTKMYVCVNNCNNLWSKFVINK